MRRCSGTLGVALLGMLASCSSAPAPSFTSRPPVVAEYDAETWSQMRRAEAAYFRGAEDEALELVEPLVRAHPLFVPAVRLRQVILLERGRGALLADEAQRALARDPDRPEAEYLALRLIPDLHVRYQRIDAAVQRFPRSWWLRYSYCWSLVRRRSPLLREKAFGAELLRLAKFRMPWAGGALLATSLRPNSVKREPFVARLNELRARMPESRPQIDLALFVAGDDLWERVRSGLAEAPYAPTVTNALLNVSRDTAQSRQFVAWLRRDAALREVLLEAGHGRYLLQAAERVADVAFADSIRRELVRARRDSSLGRSGRWVLPPRQRILQGPLVRGDLEAALAFYETSLPAVLRDDGRNRMEPRLKALLAGPGRGLRACPADGRRAVAVFRALLDAGWVEEASLLGRSWGPKHPELAPLLEEAERFQRFELGLTELAAAGSSKRRLVDFLAEIRALAESIYGEDVIGDSRVLRFPIIGGRIVDPFGPGLPLFFDRYSRHLIFGTLDEPVRRPQIAFGRKVFERRLPVSKDLYVPGRSREVIVEHTSFSATSNMAFSEPAGVALWNHYVIDLRKWDEWGVGLERMWERMRQNPDLPLADPIPECDPCSMAQPAQVHWRLLARVMRDRRWSVETLRAEVLKLLRLHEQAHLVDAQRFLPALRKLGAAVRLFARSGFSQASLMADLEGRAEIAALASGADPHLTLSHLAGFAGDAFERTASPHRVGFGRMLRRIVEMWHADGAPGAVKPGSNLLAQLHLIDPDRARRYAQRILTEDDF